jgi:ATP-binding cassette subfamily F protein uup
VRRKLVYKEQRELDQLPGRIEALEARIGDLGAAMQDPGFYRQDAAAITAAQREVAELQVELDAAYRRWEALDAG